MDYDNLTEVSVDPGATGERIQESAVEVIGLALGAWGAVTGTVALGYASRADYRDQIRFEREQREWASQDYYAGFADQDDDYYGGFDGWD